MKSQKKILFVTSDDDTLASFKKALFPYDVELVHARTYNEAIELLQSDHYGLVMTELFISADGVQESFDSIMLEIDILENDLRLKTPFQEDLLKLRNLIRSKDGQKLFPLGSRLANESTLMMNKTMLLLNLQDQGFDQEEFKEHLDCIAIYYHRRGNNVYYSPWGYTDEVVKRFVEEDLVSATQLEKVY